MAEYLRVFCHVGFFVRPLSRHGSLLLKAKQMDTVPLAMAERLAEIASAMQQQRTGHAPEKVTVVLSDDTLVVTLQEALTPAEKALAQSPPGAAQVQEFHRQLFSNSCGAFKDEIKRITGRQVHQAAGEIEPAMGAVVHAFTTGAMVQVFLLVKDVATGKESAFQSQGPS